MRVVAICPSNTEIVCALGLQKHLIGADRWSLRDPAFELEGVVDIGQDLAADLDRVEALRPDLVLASESVPGMEKNVAGLEARGLSHIVVDGHSWEGVKRGIRQVAQALGEPARGEAVVQEMDTAAAEVSQRARTARAALGRGAPQMVAWEWWPKPIIVAGRNSWITDLFGFLGLRNAFEGMDAESGPVEAEAVAARRPDAICASWCGTGEHRMTVSAIAGREGWGAVPAVRKQRIYLLPESYFGRPGPGLVHGLRLLCDCFYGDAETSQRAAQQAAQRAGLGPHALVWDQA